MAYPGVAQDGGFVNTQYFIPSNANNIQQQQQQQQLLSVQTPGFLQRFNKGDPLALGVAQIFIGLTNVALGIILTASSLEWVPFTVATGSAFWGGLLFLISGSLSVSAQKNGTIGLVKGSLAMNIFSTLSATSGMAMCAIDMTNYYYYVCPSGDSQLPCMKYREGYFVFRTAILAFLLILSLLEFCISISTSAFGCKSVCGKSSLEQTAQPMFVMQNAYTQDPRVQPTQLMGIQMVQGGQIPYAMPNAKGNRNAPGHTTMPFPDYE